MGKIVTIYLSDQEIAELKGFCDENRCTQYSALKTAVRELLSRPIKKAEEKTLNNHEEETPEEDSEGDETPEERKQTEKPSAVKTISLIKRLAHSRARMM